MSSMTTKRRKWRKCISFAFFMLTFLVYGILRPNDASHATIFYNLDNYIHILGVVLGSLISFLFFTTFLRRLYDFIEDLVNRSWYERSMSHISEFLIWNFTDLFFIRCGMIFGVHLCLLLILYLSNWFKIDASDFARIYGFPFLAATVIALWETCKCPVMYSNVTLNDVLGTQPCPATLWATAACRAYFIPVTESLQERIAAFEQSHGVQIVVKKLFLVIPRSCDVRGLLDKFPNIEYYGDLPSVITDHGGSVNRRFKNPVYKILADDGQALYHVVMESSSSLLPLYKLRTKMPENLLNFQYSAYVSVMEEKLWDSACIILEYDDISPQISLSEFIIQNVKCALMEEKEKFQIYRD